ncbi:MAG: hypothetical protein IAF00_00985 [Phycisphaerales bacterium]|nr:hypothetical protein [Phycisphaerales bacterium]
MQAFPEMKGFSKRNLEQICRWYYYWSKDTAITKQPASQLPVAQYRDPGSRVA